MISYGNNLEDVLIMRALQDVDGGFYVDVGASIPVDASNTYALYQRGWSGIAIDPLIDLIPDLALRWQTTRPRDRLVKVAAGAETGRTRFWLCMNYLQMSSGSRRTIDARLRDGASINESDDNYVDTVRVDSLLEPGQDVHLLSIDVEGMEGEVLAGIDLARFRPWLMVIESSNGDDWEPRLLDHAYVMVWEDAISRFYLAHEHSDLKRWFRFPPNTLEYKTWRETKLEQRVRELEREIGQQWTHYGAVTAARG